MRASGRLAAAIGPALVATTLLNGGASYLKRVGLLDRPGYEAHWQIHCADGRTRPRPLGLGRECVEERPATAERDEAERSSRAFVHQTAGAGESAAKLAKDAFLVALVALALSGRPPRRELALRCARPFVAVSLTVALAAARAVLRGAGRLIVAGARGFWLLVVALAGAASNTSAGLGSVASGVAWLVSVQVLLLVPETLYGLHLYGEHTLAQVPRRLAAALIHPNSLGVFAVVALGFCRSFSDRRRTVWLYAAAAILVLAAASATGVVVLCALAVLDALDAGRLRLTGRLVLAAAAGTLILAALLPTLLGRPDLYASVRGEGGRLQQLDAALSGSAGDVLFGRGLGYGTNAAANLPRGWLPPEAGPCVPPADSTVTLLAWQTGLLGVCAFYALLAWAWRSDAAARAFYLSILLSSATMNVTELFPVNALLGLALGHSLLVAGGGRGDDVG